MRKAIDRARHDRARVRHWQRRPHAAGVTHDDMARQDALLRIVNYDLGQRSGACVDAIAAQAALDNHVHERLRMLDTGTRGRGQRYLRPGGNSRNGLPGKRRVNDLSCHASECARARIQPHGETRRISAPKVAAQGSTDRAATSWACSPRSRPRLLPVRSWASNLRRAKGLSAGCEVDSRPHPHAT